MRFASSLPLLAALFLVAPVTQAETLAYPTPEHPDFLIDVPDGWDVEAAEEAGGFVNITGPTGVLLSMRTVSLDEFSTDDVIEETKEFLQENYGEVQFAPLQKDENGTLILGGHGKNDGEPVIFSNVYLVQRGKFIAEVRAVFDYGDDAGGQQTKQFLDTMRFPE